jgi:membrane protease YdiL (CAAX protease family)
MFTSPSGRMRPIWSFLLSIAFSVAAFLACGYVADAFTGDHVFRFELIFRPLLAALLFGIYLWLLTVADHVEEHPAAVLGFARTPGWKHQLAGGSFLGLVLVVTAVVPLAIWANLTFTFHSPKRSVARVVAVLIILMFGALAEELMFRGYPFQRLEEAIGAGGAIATFSVLFGAVHLTNPGASALGLLNTVLIGTVLAVAYLRTRALWLPWGIHFGWNTSLGLIFGLPVSGLRLFNVAVRTSAAGPRWLTGGSYGMEASLPGVLAVVIGLIVVWRWPVHRLGEKLTEPRPECEHLDSSAGIESDRYGPGSD